MLLQGHAHHEGEPVDHERENDQDADARVAVAEQVRGHHAMPSPALEQPEGDGSSHRNRQGDDHLGCGEPGLAGVNHSEGEPSHR